MARTIAKDHAAKRAHILKTAAQVFAAEGVARASMAQVARACGISKANIYHYYGSKDALLFDILDSYLSTLRARVCTLPLADMPPRARLHRFVSETLLAYDGMDAEHQIQTEGLPLLPAAEQEILRKYQRDMVRSLGDILVDIAPQSFENGAEKRRAATMSVFGMMNWYYKWNKGADQKARAEYARIVSRLVLDGLGGLAETDESVVRKTGPV